METKDNYQLLNRLDDYIDLALYKYTTSTTRFLNPAEQSLAIDKLTKTKGIKYKIEGGYEQSERNIIIIYPDEDYIELDEYLALAKVDFTKYDRKYLNHRMILGSVLALGIKRDGVGDIILDTECGYIVATKQMAKYIAENLVQVGGANVSTTYIDSTAEATLNLKEPKIITGTIASLRIDCILSLALKISRTKACDLIANQLVFVNWQLATKSTMQIEENQIITVRKKGRIILKSIGNASRKNRIWVEVEVLG